MGLMKYILILAIIIGAIWYFSPSTFDFLKNKAAEVVDVNNTNADIVDEKLKDLVGDNDSDNSTENVTEKVPVGVCGLPNFGFPDYEGTNKEGDDCRDTMGDKDLECLSNPPINYEGSIDLPSQTSTPEIYCCIVDGYCRWGGSE